jgi:DNA invertase Pin-like site-specific DNA recombinase
MIAPANKVTVINGQKFVAPGTPICRAYIRVSSFKQLRSELGLEAQMEMIERYRKIVMPDMVYEAMDDGSPFRDPFATSGAKPFLKRKAGCELDCRLKAGDHILFASVDRAFRSMGDGATIVKRWREKGIIIHFVRDGITVSKENDRGLVFFNTLLFCAEMEHLFNSMRTKSALAAKAERDEVTGGAVRDILWITTRKGKSRRVNHHNRRVIAHAMYLHETEGLGREALWRRLNKEGLRQSNGNRISDKHLRADYFAHCRELGIVAEKYPDALRK